MADIVYRCRASLQELGYVLCTNETR